LARFIARSVPIHPNRKEFAMRFKAVVVLLALFAVPLAGCATVKGAGEDLQSASESVNDEIHER
jgi:predicted small secreted protein